MQTRPKNKPQFLRFVKYTFSSGVSFAVDLGLFTLFQLVIDVFWATILARILSSLLNFTINSRFVFKQQSSLAIFKYYLLVIVQMFVSATLTSLFVNLIPIHATIIKLAVDIFIFLVNYFIQKRFIFTKDKESSHPYDT